MQFASRAKDLFDALSADGEAQIDKMIAEQVSEELFIDYKRSGNDANDSKLHPSDRENFARAVSGFGNSEGGVIVWGVDCRNDPVRGDVPGTKFPLTLPKRFVSYLEGMTSGSTLPPHDGVRHHTIETPGTNQGFVVTYIPKSLYAPHQCIVGKHKDRYFIRAGSDFIQTPHGLLAGMFGKRPNPIVFAMWEITGNMTPASYEPFVTDLPTSVPKVMLKVVLRNDGLVVAKDLFANISFRLPGPECDARLSDTGKRFERHESLGVWHLISEPTFRLAPSSMIEVMSFSVYLKPPIATSFDFELVLGCAESPVHRINGKVSEDSLRSACAEFLSSDKGKDAGAKLARVVFDLERIGRTYPASIGY